MKTSTAIAVALGLLVTTASTTPARADGGTTAIIIGSVLLGSTIKCGISPDARAIDSLCWLSPLTYAALVLGPPRGNITVKPRKKRR